MARLRQKKTNEIRRHDPVARVWRPHRLDLLAFRIGTDRAIGSDMENATDGLVTCGKCGGNGLFFFYDRTTGPCYPCEGTGRVEATEAPAPARIKPWTTDRARLTLRGMYRNARLSTENPCHLSYAAVVGQGSTDMGWTAAGLAELLDLVPGSREAFRALGWPV